MKESEMKEVAKLIMKVISDPNNSELKLKVRGEVEALCSKFPIYNDL
jgi:glycine/serine hydroxymethyltransferase